MHRSFLPYVRQLIEEQDLSFTFVDVGSRNGLLELHDLAPYVVAYGFEPNPDEYAKLVSGDTDASHVGARTPPFRKLTYLPYALGDRCGTTELYITRGPGAVGILEPNFDRLREIKWKGRTYHPNFGDEIFHVFRVERVELKTLEWFLREHAIKHVDYLKVDVEGFEYEVLAGAGAFLNAISLIRVEVCFIPFRKNQKLFSHVDLLLRDYNFDLLRYEIVPSQVGYKERDQAFTIGPSLGFPDRYGQPLSCDAIYVNRGVTDEARIAALAVLLLEKNYLDEALFLFQTKLSGINPVLLQALRQYRGDVRTQIVEAAVRGYRLWQRLGHPLRSYRRWRGWRWLANRGVVRPQR